MSEKDRKKLIHLYFERLFSFEELENYFDNRYPYSVLKAAIKEEINKGNDSYFENTGEIKPRTRRRKKQNYCTR